MAVSYSPDQIERVRMLLEEGKHYRDIQKITGVSRHTISKIANGQNVKLVQGPIAYSKGYGTEQGKCPVCLRKMFKPNEGWPCLACRARR